PLSVFAQVTATTATYPLSLHDALPILVGTPAVSLPAVVPGVPTSIPEIALMKKNDQRGVAKIGVFAYNRVTGRALWQSGMVESRSEEHTSELQSLTNLVCRLLLETEKH